MENKTCGTCKFWEEVGQHGRELDCGTCAAIPGFDDTKPAHVEDGSGYFAALRTKENFGCTLWEGKE